MAFVTAAAVIPCALYAFYLDYNGPKADLRARGYSAIRMGTEAPGACPKPYHLSRRFQAVNRRGETIEGVHCSSQLFGYDLKLETRIAATPVSPP